MGGHGSGVRSQVSEVGGQRSEVGSQSSEDRRQIADWRIGDMAWGIGQRVRSQEPESRIQQEQQWVAGMLGQM